MAKRRKKKAAGRRPSLTRLTTSDLLRELSTRGGEIQQMRAEREQLVGRIAEIDETLSMLGERVSPAGRRPGRPAGKKADRKAGRKAGGRPKSAAARTRASNSMTLEQAMYKTLKGKTMGVQELAKAVVSGGYKTNAENFRTMVNQTLLRSEHFKKVARGQYTTA